MRLYRPRECKRHHAIGRTVSLEERLPDLFVAQCVDVWERHLLEHFYFRRSSLEVAFGATRHISPRLEARADVDDSFGNATLPCLDVARDVSYPRPRVPAATPSGGFPF